ncbi:structural maintenance of chromosomes protein 6 [Phymastichus coffea]|uniref:structural maintenance of chromosomes protein 6 n=1 Tax=Phymastichus coffea TaxID=108790 RepID=UPI00273AA61B|nr:structural maintenance of chromosomes protein 6 [Phymastichus coffea]XP_058791644.1 structural maintenance of chromosomes protein 6 [Phymastichus coffea]
MGEETLSQSRKRKTTTPEEIQSKRVKNRNSQNSSDIKDDTVNDELVPGKIKRIFLKNFMCHDALEMNFNSRINFLVGVNGSGKSAILTALTVGLGAKAKDTDRGVSLKNFVKQGKSSATIEITITNRGDKSYKWETYGDTITVIRIIGTTSLYRIKSHSGQVISTKKEELKAITNALNIQVDNPISILNQDAARSFLLTKKSDDLYKFYMKATRLDVVGENYRTAQSASDLAKCKLADSRKYLSDSENVIKTLRHKLQALQSLDIYREEYQQLKNEVLWAEVLTEEKKLLQIDQKIDLQSKEIEMLENIEFTKASKEKEIISRIEEHNAEIASHKAEAAANEEKCDGLKKKAMEKKNTLEQQRTKVQKLHKNMSEKKNDLQLLMTDINQKEKEECDVDVKRQEARYSIEECEQQLDEILATLRTKQTDLMHFEENSNRLDKEEKAIKIEIDSKKRELNAKIRDLEICEKQSDNALTVYGNNIPRLVRRIEEEHQRGRFRKKPVGPLGAYISIKDPSWIPAIESFLGIGMLRTFCVDNLHDRTLLNKIMSEIFTNEHSPSIIISKFFDDRHDVECNCTRSPQYDNMLDMMIISDNTVANTLIDQREIERVLLIPTSKEACDVMSDFRKVPQNCRRAITKMNDLFFPDPNYKTYGGSAGERPKFLQVSTAERIRDLQDDIAELGNQLKFHKEQYAQIHQRKAITIQELNQVQQQVRNLLGKQSSIKNKIEESKEILESHNNNTINEHKLEVEHIKEWLVRHKEEMTRMMEEYRRLEQESKVATEEYKTCRTLSTNLDVALNPIKEKILELKDEQKRLNVTNRGASKRLQEGKQSLQRLKGEHQQQQRVVTTKTTLAEACCPRIDTTKTVAEISARSKELMKFIENVEREHGNKEALQEELQEQEQQFDKVFDNACELERLNEVHTERVRVRKHFFNNMKADIAAKVQTAFANILSLRNYEGTVTVDHKKHKLELEMVPINDAKRLTNDAKQLSGGERSYSTIGFILALWHCTGLPFYFLDEFDVFMDKINRRMIIDILIHHAETSPNSQFTFLTPLDASHLKAKNSITIHRMTPPERSG